MASIEAPVFLVGGTPGIAERAAAAITAVHPGLRVCGSHHGFVAPSDIPELTELISLSGAALVLIGAGAPIQERLAVRVGERKASLVLCTCGGYFDQVSRPGSYYPRWAYSLKLNWVVRLCREPRRLWRRYLLGNPRFVIDSVIWRARTRGSGR
jgi:N-acetylglucosaminyldiphosphoundecaprenol N-acetyl-beta-D-mannosaminyltransferase